MVGCIFIILLFLCYEITIKKDELNSFYNTNVNMDNNSKNNIISQKIRLLKLMTNNNELEYKGIKECLLNDPDINYCIYHLIATKKVLGKKIILYGEKRDGSYVLLDDLTNIKIAYSFGISSNVHFDKALADKGIDIYMYDHTINSLPYENHKLYWKKIGICG